MFRSLSFVGVASAAIIESRPHEHLQMANAQLQNATEAVIKTAAVAGLAYAGAYMAAAGTTPGAYDSSRRSQASSTGHRYCDTRERDPLKYKCSAEYFNGVKADNAADPQVKVAVRNYWCCPAPDLGGKYIGDLNGVCVNQNNGASTFAAVNQGAGGCTYQGPCIAGGNAVAGAGASTEVSITGATITAVGTSVTPVTGANTGTGFSTGACNSNGNVGLANAAAPATADPAQAGMGIFGGIPGGYFGGIQTDTAAASTNPSLYPGGVDLGAQHGLAYANGGEAFKCCIKTDQGDDGTFTYSLDPTVLKQPISVCVPNALSTPQGYTCNA